MQQPFRFRHLDAIVGTFVLGGLAALLAAIALVSLARGWLAFDRTELVAVTEAIPDHLSLAERTVREGICLELEEQLRPGTPVRSRGEVIGKIVESKVDESRRLRVRMEVRGSARDGIFENSRAQVRLAMAGVLGETAIVIKPVPSLNKLAKDQSLVLEPAIDPVRAAAGLLEEVRTQIPPLVADVHTLVKNLNTTVTNAQGTMQAADAAVRQVSADVMQITANGRLEALFKRIESITASADAIAKGLAAGEGTAGKLLKDPATMDQAMALMADLRVVTTELKGLAPQLPHMARSVDDALVGSQRLLDGLSRHWLLRGAMAAEPEEADLAPRGAAIIPEAK